MNQFIGSWSVWPVVNPCLDTLERFNDSLALCFLNYKCKSWKFRLRKVIVDISDSDALQSTVSVSGKGTQLKSIILLLHCSFNDLSFFSS